MKYEINNKLLGLWCSLFRHTRKNNHFIFFIKGFYRYLQPRCLAQRRLRRLLGEYYKLPMWEQEYITHRVDYYCKFNDAIFLPEDATTLGDFTYRKRISYIRDYINSTYFFDAYEYLRFFSKRLKWVYHPGDINYLFPIPEITKSRPHTVDNSNSNNILLNLDKVRHFTWVYDPFTWEQKECRILFRGDASHKPHRIRFIEMWKEHPLCDLSSTSDMTLFNHLRYRYIMSLEGNDVASNLKWVMSSNSVAVMPRPTYETWYMEGQLIPNYHYIEISKDYHDLIDRINYYEEHPDEVKAIVRHAHEWVELFQNKKRENLISLMVLDKYFFLTGQTNRHSIEPQRYFINELVKLSIKQKLNAQGKAREDVCHTLSAIGYEKYDIINHKYSWGRGRIYHYYPFFSKLMTKRQAKKFISIIRPGDTVLIQDFQWEYMQFITRECKMRKANVIFLVHDVKCLRFDVVTHEIDQLNAATLLLVHTEAMASKLKSMGVTAPMKVIQLFDYYSTEPMQSVYDTIKRKEEIVFAGNLTKSKFLKILIGNPVNKTVSFKLYGVRKKLNIPTYAKLYYCGVFSPEKTSAMKGGWGLVWDGNSIDTCTGDYGEYLRYNSSHKISLYLACGIPVIVWENSSLADLIKKEKIGITVSSLRCIDECISGVSDEAYVQMVTNARIIGEKLRNGEYLKVALKDIDCS